MVIVSTEQPVVGMNFSIKDWWEGTTARRNKAIQILEWYDYIEILEKCPIAREKDVSEMKNALKTEFAPLNVFQPELIELKFIAKRNNLIRYLEKAHKQSNGLMGLSLQVKFILQMIINESNEQEFLSKSPVANFYTNLMQEKISVEDSSTRTTVIPELSQIITAPPEIQASSRCSLM